jgi:2-amino-4-hydroxy-6-hydroxymethyldihydropteridine diphosphokinase
VTVRRAYLGLGSNLGDRRQQLQAALDGLAGAPQVRVVAVSSVYETSPVGGPSQPDYLNAVVALDTDRSPRALLELAQDLERRARRVRNVRFGPRTLDVDVLLVGDEQVHEPDLEVPHPRLRERGFVLAPLGDLDADAAGDAPEGGWPGVRRTDLILRVP